MRKVILQFVKATFPVVAVISTLLNTAQAQPSVVADKDNTHPEQTDRQYIAAKVTRISATRMHGYNEIQWSAFMEDDTRKFIVEYSHDGINFQSAGEQTPLTGSYFLKHHTGDDRALLYRIRVEKKDGRFFNSAMFVLDGSRIPPVKIYPTIVDNNTVNMQIDFPVQRVAIFASDGRQVFAKDLNGFTGYNQMVIPSLGKGIYFMAFYGNGWKSTERFMIGR